jgi:hypothetical protein
MRQIGLLLTLVGILALSLIKGQAARADKSDWAGDTFYTYLPAVMKPPVQPVPPACGVEPDNNDRLYAVEHCLLQTGVVYEVSPLGQADIDFVAFSITAGTGVSVSMTNLDDPEAYLIARLYPTNIEGQCIPHVAHFNLPGQPLYIFYEAAPPYQPTGIYCLEFQGYPPAGEFRFHLLVTEP